MIRVTVDVDERALGAARRELGADGLSDTINAALRDAARRWILEGSTLSETSKALRMKLPPAVVRSERIS